LHTQIRFNRCEMTGNIREGIWNITEACTSMGYGRARLRQQQKSRGHLHEARHVT
jgi:hypothetical protein